MEKNISAFLKVLESTDNSTGGGTASAIASAMAASLVGMVARLSIGKKGMRPEDFYKNIAFEAENLSHVLFSGGRRDSEAFSAVSSAYKMPKEKDHEKFQRQKAIQDAMVQATQIPLDNAQQCSRTLELITLLKGCFNPNAASDLECAEYLARAGLLGCLANVQINLPFIKDNDTAKQIKKMAHKLRQLVAEGQL